MDYSILKGIADSPAILEALRSILEKQFDLKKLSHNDPIDLLGETVKANLVALKGINKAFDEIANYRTPQKAVPVINRAR